MPFLNGYAVDEMANLSIFNNRDFPHEEKVSDFTPVKKAS